LAADRHLVVVPHTHWDREWYRTFEEFRYRLVRLVDGLLDLLERDPAFSHFTLDGQTIVVDDYLELRPHARERIARLVRAGRLLVGPWYVLPDEWLVSGEALIRNLRRGMAAAARLGGAMPVGYVPDQFGHVGQLPQILAGFGISSAVLWRGVGDDVDQTLFEWEAPDGTKILAAYLPQGYGNAAHLPLDPSALAERLAAAASGLAPFARIPTLLLMNGSDHLPPQPGLPAALAQAAAKLLGLRVELGTLAGYLERARREARALPHHRGELRSGLRAPLLAGCASSRAPQKRADFANDLLLTRYLEPLAAWLGALGGEPDLELIDHAWGVALQNHPHDSICGCSVDAVHEQMDSRFARVREIAETHLRRVLTELGRRVSLPARGFGPGAREALLVWNPGSTGRALAEGVLELDLPELRRRGAHVRDASGRRLPAHAEVVEPGRDFVRYELPARVVSGLVLGFPPEFMGHFPRGMRLRQSGGRAVVEVVLGRERDEGFDLAAARRQLAERVEREGHLPVVYRVRRLPAVRMRFVDELPGLGLRVYRLARGRAGAAQCPRTGRSGDGGAWIENEAWRVEAAPDGRVRCVHLETGTAIDDALRIVSEGDRGDTYTFDPVPGGGRVERPERARVALDPDCEAQASLRIDAVYGIPRELARRRSARSARCVRCPVRTRISLLAGLDAVEVSIEVDQRARDHRLRAHLRAPFRAERFEVESAFEIAERPIAPGPGAFGSRPPAEYPSGATPQRGFATVAGGGRALTVAGAGCAEVEAVPEADGTSALAVTLLRAVGWLSRDDLAMRPAPAGPPLETPGAQVPGRHRARLSFRLHPDGERVRAAEALRFGSPARIAALPATASGGVVEDGARLLEVDDPEVVVSAIEPRAGGGAEIRLWNASSEGRRVALRWRGHVDRVPVAHDLAGRPLVRAELSPDATGRVRLGLRPWQIATLRVP
jgi:alpha-mannosidase